MMNDMGWNKKAVRGLVACAAGATLLAGCGGSDDGTRASALDQSGAAASSSSVADDRCTGETVGTLPAPTAWGNTAKVSVKDQPMAIRIAKPVEGGSGAVSLPVSLKSLSGPTVMFPLTTVQLVDEAGRLCEGSTGALTAIVVPGKVSTDKRDFALPARVDPSTVRAVVMDASGKAQAVFAASGATDAPAPAANACTGQAAPTAARPIAFGQPATLTQQGRAVGALTVSKPVLKKGKPDEDHDVVQVPLKLTSDFLVNFYAKALTLVDSGARTCPAAPDPITGGPSLFAIIAYQGGGATTKTVEFQVPRGFAGVGGMSVRFKDDTYGAAAWK